VLASGFGTVASGALSEIFWNVLGEHFIFIEKEDIPSKKRTYGRSASQCYSYATWTNLSKADTKSKINEWRFKLMRSTYVAFPWPCIQ